MKELRTLLLAALVFTFLGGLGVGAWVGNLQADSGTTRYRKDPRVQDFAQMLNLNATQTRRVAELLAQMDRKIERIRTPMSAEVRRKIDQVQEQYRRLIMKELDDAQRQKYRSRREGR